MTFQEFAQFNVIYPQSSITQQTAFNWGFEGTEIYDSTRGGETHLPSVRLLVRYHADSITDIKIPY